MSGAMTMSEIEAEARALCRASIMERVRTAALPEELPEEALQEEIEYRWRSFVDAARVEAAARAWYHATEADDPNAAQWDDEWPVDTLWLRDEYRARARRFLAAMPSRSDVLEEAADVADRKSRDLARRQKEAWPHVHIGALQECCYQIAAEIRALKTNDGGEHG
jgi:hypothetical protein